MPKFNTFNINEELLGKVIKSKKNDCILSEEELKEAKEIYTKFKNKEERKSLLHLLLEKVTNKKLKKFRDSNNMVRFREEEASTEYVPVKQLKSTVQRPMEFGDDLFGWIEYIQAERKRIEEERIKAKNDDICLKGLTEVYSKFIEKRMMVVN